MRLGQETRGEKDRTGTKIKQEVNVGEEERAKSVPPEPGMDPKIPGSNHSFFWEPRRAWELNFNDMVMCYYILDS